jgi:NAD(P)H-hydrate epimerase
MKAKVEPVNSSVGFNKLKKKIKAATLIIDALLGTGLKGELKAPFKKIVALINRSGKKVLAIDVPSGLNCDTGRPKGKDAVCADVTVTFGLPKRGFFKKGAKKYLGKLIVADISIPQELLK